MKTDQFIELLTTNLEPADPRKTSRVFGGAVLLGSAVALGVALLALGLRADLRDPSAVAFLWLKLLFSGSIAALASIYLLKAARPGGDRKISVAILLPFSGIMALALASLILSPSSHWKDTVSGDQWLECVISIPLIAIAPFAAIIWAVRQAAPTNLRRTGALVGLVAGSLSAMGYALHCVDDSIPFIAIWYSATIALCTLVGAVLGPRLLRW